MEQMDRTPPCDIAQGRRAAKPPAVSPCSTEAYGSGDKTGYKFRNRHATRASATAPESAVYHQI